MDTADGLVDKIFFMADLQKNCADDLDELAAEVENERKAVNTKLVAGSAVSALGSAAVLAAAACTGGILVPALAYTGKAVSMVGLGINVGSEVAVSVNSDHTKKEEEIYQKVANLEQEIQALTKSIAEEEQTARGTRNITQEDYVTERILRAMAKRCGLTINHKVSIPKLVSGCLKKGSPLAPCTLRIAGSLECFLIYKLVYNILKPAQAGRTAVSKVIGSTVTSAASKQAVKAAGSKASGKALKYATRGAFGLVFSGAELIYNLATLNNCETDSSKRLRENAKAMRTQSENMKEELDVIQNMFKELAAVRKSIDSSHRSLKEKQTLMDFAIKQCEDEEVRTWLIKNVNSEDFSKLVDVFCFLHEELNKQRRKIDKEDIDVIFVAHGSIKDPLIPANCLLPLPTIQDVVLYSPWNCSLSADAAYGISTGYLKPEHRIFYGWGEKTCKIPNKPTKLPNSWNSMKKAGELKIPNISVSPLRVPEDGAWGRLMWLQSKYGGSGRNRVLIPFILPGESKFLTVPFFVVTLALSLVLYFSRFEATVHLAACLSRSSKLPKSDLNQQYSYTIDETVMTSSKEMLPKTYTYLSKLFKAMFGQTSL